MGLSKEMKEELEQLKNYNGFNYPISNKCELYSSREDAEKNIHDLYELIDFVVSHCKDDINKDILDNILIGIDLMDNLFEDVKRYSNANKNHSELFDNRRKDFDEYASFTFDGNDCGLYPVYSFRFDSKGKYKEYDKRIVVSCGQMYAEVGIIDDADFDFCELADCTNNYANDCDVFITDEDTSYDAIVKCFEQYENDEE